MDLQFRAPGITAFQTTSASCGTVTVSDSQGGTGTGTGSGGDTGGDSGGQDTGAGTGDQMMAGVGGTTLLVLVIVAAAAAYTVTT